MIYCHVRIPWQKIVVFNILVITLSIKEIQRDVYISIVLLVTIVKQNCQERMGGWGALRAKIAPLENPKYFPIKLSNKMSQDHFWQN